MGIFDFLDGLDGYEDRAKPARRMNKRHKLIIDPVAGEIEGARLLDLGAQDGRWSYAFAAAGAREVVAVEPREDLTPRYEAFPEAEFKSRVRFRHADLFDALEADLASGERYDVIAVLGILYHILDHGRLISLLRAHQPKLVIIDSEFMTQANPMIQLSREKTEKHLNAAPAFDGQTTAVIGTPSRMALEILAESYDLATTWIDAKALFGTDRSGVQDYFRQGNKRRATCHLRPI